MVFNKASLTRGLTLAANILANEMRRVTTVGNYPSEIPTSITVGTVIVFDTGASIGISTDPNDEKGQAPAITLAYELGSGLFGKKKQRYKITPKKSRLLAFPVGEWDAYMEPPPKPGLSFIFPEVEHPGIRPRPFVINSIVKVSDKMMEAIDQNFVLDIFEGPKVEVIK